MIQLTDKQLVAVFPLSTAANRAKYLGPLNDAFTGYGVNTLPRLRAFLAIVGIETGQLRAVTENLNYSADGLRKTFGKYFPTAELANLYARQPEKIANRVYGGRMGNGQESSGEGWKYRGRGLIQLTGKDNYAAASNGMYALPMGVDFVDEPDLIATPEYAAQSAAWFFEMSKAADAADKLDTSDEYEAFKKIVRIVNGGYNGLAERWEMYKRAKMVIV
jgi:putative chitinase